MGGCWRTVVLRAEHHGTLWARRGVRRWNSPGCKARRFAYRAADEVRDGGESENRQGDWDRTSDRHPATRRRGDRVIRRDFITLFGGATAWALAARAQQAPRAARLGYLAPASNPELQQALLGGLRDLCYVEGHNLAIEYRLMLGQSKTYDELAAQLARLVPDAIVV